MVQVFFEDLDLPLPNKVLAVGADTQSRQLGQIMCGVEETLAHEGTGTVVVQGDTNSTLGGALVASREQRPVVHVESGCRSFNRSMPEEINRIVVDHVCDLLFAATETDLKNLRNEGLMGRTHLVGSTGVEACLRNAPKADAKSAILSRLEIKKRDFGLATVHRLQNTENGASLTRILQALDELGSRTPIVFPVHPRTADAMRKQKISWPKALIQTAPLRYFDFLALLSNAAFVLTDSGGVQEEAAYLGTRCFTLREETEWSLTLDSGVNTLVGTDPERITFAVDRFLSQGGGRVRVEPAWPKGILPSSAIMKELEKW
jgi:UDP-N-acetylglucosamine 2-epimerase